MGGYQYLSCHPLGRQLLAPALRLSDPTWTEVVNGNGSFSAKLAIPRMAEQRQQLAGALEPDYAAIYVLDDAGNYPFGGPIVEQLWDRAAGTIDIKAVDWRTWLYNVFLGPKVDLTGDNTYSWTQIDQLLVAQQIVNYAITGGTTDGRPSITIGTEVSGVLRDLNIKGLDFKYAGELLDTMSQRANGFEWDIVPYTDNTDGLPRLRFVMGFPELGALQTGLVLKNTAGGANMTIDGAIARSSAARRTRVWATGQTETLPFAVDSDPDLVNSSTLLSERVTSYSTVTERTTLALHANAERVFLNPMLNLLSVNIPEATIDPSAYSAGDRARLIYRDDWYDLELNAARIVERTVAPARGAGVVKAKLDLTDYELPESDSGTSAP